MTIQTILAVVAWVFSMVAVSIAICTRAKANDNSDWFQNRINRITEKFCEVEKLRSYDKSEFWSLSKRVDDLENQLSEEEDCEPCRPRTYVVEYGDESDVLWKVKCDLLTQITADQTKEILLLRKENKELKKNQCRKYEKGE